MQALKNLFSRAQTQRAAAQQQAQTTAPTELSAESLQLVGGGLPRVGGLGGSSTAPDTSTSSATTLPSAG